MTHSDSEKWYCSLPWTGFSNDPDGRVRPCCLYKEHIKDNTGNDMYVQTHSLTDIFHSNTMIALRNEFREGKKPPGCSTCIVDEKNGHKSKRQIYTRNQHGTHNPITNFDVEPSIPTEYQMIISNACNLKCRSCSPSHSNLWQAEYKIVYGHNGFLMQHKQSGDKTGLLWQNRKEWYNTIKKLEIVGGEPFYIGQWEEIWDEMIAHGVGKNIMIDMSSNATIYAEEKLAKLCANFNQIGLGLSIDGMGETYDYLRHPGKWDEVSENIIKYSRWKHDNKIDNLSISISHTIGWLNVYWIPEFKEWLDQNTVGLSFWYNTIHNPPHMTLWALPKAAKEIVEDKLLSWGQDHDNVIALINYMNSKQPTDDELRELYTTFTLYDQVRNEDIFTVIPADIFPYIKHLII